MNKFKKSFVGYFALAAFLLAPSAFAQEEISAGGLPDFHLEMAQLSAPDPLPVADNSPDAPVAAKSSGTRFTDIKPVRESLDYAAVAVGLPNMLLHEVAEVALGKFPQLEVAGCSFSWAEGVASIMKGLGAGALAAAAHDGNDSLARGGTAFLMIALDIHYCRSGGIPGGVA